MSSQKRALDAGSHRVARARARGAEAAVAAAGGPPAAVPTNPGANSASGSDRRLTSGGGVLVLSSTLSASGPSAVATNDTVPTALPRSGWLYFARKADSSADAQPMGTS
jgi:hypothetical protein